MVKPPRMATDTITTVVDPNNSSQVGQVHFFNSCMVSANSPTDFRKRALPPQHDKDHQGDHEPDYVWQQFFHLINSLSWRRGRDSNPRCGFPHNGFQDRRNRPLCHPSESSPGAQLHRSVPLRDSLCRHHSINISHIRYWQGGRDSNPQPTVLETATLPIELPPSAVEWSLVSGRSRLDSCPWNQVTMSATRPAPIVRPPSRMAKRWPFSMATGAINSTSTETLSPGITISMPWARVTVPVTSLVRK